MINSLCQENVVWCSGWKYEEFHMTSTYDTCLSRYTHRAIWEKQFCRWRALLYNWISISWLESLSRFHKWDIRLTCPPRDRFSSRDQGRTWWLRARATYRACRFAFSPKPELSGFTSTVVLFVFCFAFHFFFLSFCNGKCMLLADDTYFFQYRADPARFCCTTPRLIYMFILLAWPPQTFICNSQMTSYLLIIAVW